jgi:ATP-dependent protease Clp ATPase subunit
MKTPVTPPDPEPLLYCYFCFKSLNEVRVLIRSDDICICDECVLVCAQIITTQGRVVTAGRHAGI